MSKTKTYAPPIGMAKESWLNSQFSIARFYGGMRLNGNQYRIVDRHGKHYRGILERAANRCEFCGVENHTYRLNPKTGKEAYIVLTIAHLSHEPEDCREENLRALCQRCHNQYDAEHRAKTRKQTLLNKNDNG